MVTEITFKYTYFVRNKFWSSLVYPLLTEKPAVNAAHKRKPYLPCGVIAREKGIAYALFIHKKAESRL